MMKNACIPDLATLFCAPVHHLIDEIDAEEMQYQTPKHVIRERPVFSSVMPNTDPSVSLFTWVGRLKQASGAGMGADSPLVTPIVKVDFVLRIRLHSQTGCQDELADCG